MIEADTSQREGRSWVSISVTDNGPGIDPEMLERLFEPFASTRLDAYGTGLGLAVAEGIVREHGGLILARNKADGSGAVFEVILPARAEPVVGLPDQTNRDREGAADDGQHPKQKRDANEAMPASGGTSVIR